MIAWDALNEQYCIQTQICVLGIGSLGYWSLSFNYVICTHFERNLLLFIYYNYYIIIYWLLMILLWFCSRDDGLWRKRIFYTVRYPSGTVWWITRAKVSSDGLFQKYSAAGNNRTNFPKTWVRPVAATHSKEIRQKLLMTVK